GSSHQLPIAHVNEEATLVPARPLGFRRLSRGSVLWEMRAQAGKRNIETETRMIRMCGDRITSEGRTAVVGEPPSATVCRPLRPKPKRIKPGRAAYRIIGVGVFTAETRPLIDKVKE